MYHSSTLAPVHSRRPVAEHQACVRAIVRPRPPLLVPLGAAAGRVLAADVMASCPLPAFDNSAVDGYAVVSADVAAAARQSPVVLPVLADIPAGCGDGTPLHRGTAYLVRDDAADLLAVIQRAGSEIDVVLTSGGISAGAYEVVKEALAPHGIDFTQVAMRPGRPQGAGVFRGVPVVALPGNPMSALISFEVFVRPAVRAAMGFSPPGRRTALRTLAEPVDSRPGLHNFRLGVEGPGETLTVLSGHQSHFLSAAARASCLLEIAPDITRLPAGACCAVWCLD